MKQAFLRSSVIVSDLLIYLPGLEEFELAEHLAMSSNVRQCLDLASKLGTKMGGAVYAAKSFAEAWQPLALLLWLLPPLVRPPSYYKFIQVQSDVQLRCFIMFHSFAQLRKLWNSKFKR